MASVPIIQRERRCDRLKIQVVAGPANRFQGATKGAIDNNFVGKGGFLRSRLAAVQAEIVGDQRKIDDALFRKPIKLLVVKSGNFQHRMRNTGAYAL